MNRLLHIFMLIALIPAFFMPAVLPVCLTNGLGTSCCATLEHGSCCDSDDADSCCQSKAVDESNEEIPPCCRKKKPKKPAPQDGSQDQIRSRCSCCLVVENLTDELDQAKVLVSLTMPPATFVLEVLERQVFRCNVPPVALNASRAPPRLLPLLI